MSRKHIALDFEGEGVAFEDVARLPTPNDNCAIAVKDLEPRTVVLFQGQSIVLSQTILVGHRFVVKRISKGEFLLSWNMPFGRALVPLILAWYDF